MDDQIGAVEGGVKELLVALEFQLVRHHVIGARQHAVGGYDDIAFDAKCRHNRAAGLF